jgi:hypothetical protein
VAVSLSAGSSCLSSKATGMPIQGAPVTPGRGATGPDYPTLYSIISVRSCSQGEFSQPSSFSCLRHPTYALAEFLRPAGTGFPAPDGVMQFDRNFWPRPGNISS